MALTYQKNIQRSMQNRPILAASEVILERSLQPFIARLHNTLIFRLWFMIGH
ncbi:MAG: hypothetical protein ACI88A_002123 [Paraglaciecola sp.]|jgi:hypothetical protein